MTEIKTYAKMNREIKKTLGFSSDHTDQYALARIMELEMESQQYKHALEFYLEIESQQYKQALEFYADEETYEIKNATDTDEIYDPFRLIDLDEGEKATKALKEGNEND